MQDILEFRSDMEEALYWRKSELMSLKSLLNEGNRVPVIKTLLVRLRNSVAHGSQKEPIEFAEFEKMEKDIFEVMEEIIKYLFQFCLEKKYLRV